MLFGKVMWFTELGCTGLGLWKFRLYSRGRLSIHFSPPAQQMTITMMMMMMHTSFLHSTGRYFLVLCRVMPGSKNLNSLAVCQLWVTVLLSG